MEVGSSWESAVEQELLILQGDFPGLLALAGVVRTAASSRPLVLSDLQQPDHGQQWGCCVGVRLRSLLGLIVSRTLFAEWYQAGSTSLEGIVKQPGLAKGMQRASHA